MERSHAAEGTQIESDIVILYTQFSISMVNIIEHNRMAWDKQVDGGHLSSKKTLEHVNNQIIKFLNEYSL